MYDKLKYVGKDSRENRGMSCITTKHWSAKIADRNSLLLPESRNFTRRRDLRTSPFVAKLAVTSARQREAREDPSARCMMQFAQAVEILARFLSSPVRIALYTAASALRSNKAKTKRPRSGLFVLYNQTHYKSKHNQEKEIESGKFRYVLRRLSGVVAYVFSKSYQACKRGNKRANASDVHSHKQGGIIFGKL